MDTLELIRKLYDENADPAELEQGLDEEGLAELHRLVEAKKAVDALPPRLPSAASLEKITALAKDANRANLASAGSRGRGRLALIISPRYIQHFAAAAAIIVAVGIGYLTMKGPDLKLDSLDAEIAQIAKDEARRSQPTSQEVVGELAEEDKLTDADQPASSLPERSKTKPRAASESEGFAKRSDAGKKEVSTDNLARLVTPSVEQEEQSVNHPTFGGRGALADAAVAAITADFDTMNWGDELDFGTFYWQVQALGERSPGDDWEEAVPLEGSFRTLSNAKRDPAWLEANSEN